MRSIRTFRHGGIRTEGEDTWIPRHPVQSAFLPNRAVVLLKQHSGSPARCVVRRGEYIREGMVIGRANGNFSGNVHAPVPGIVKEIRATLLPDGGEAEAVVIALEGSFDRLGRRLERYVWSSMSRSDMLQTINERGVIETEPPGRPVFDILRQRARTDLLVLNAIESEPFLKTETALFLDKANEVIDAMGILRKLLEPARMVIAVDSPEIEKAALEAASLAAAGASSLPSIEILHLERKYPQDLDGQLLDAIEGPRRRAKAEFLTIRPTTAFAIFEAIVLAKPMLERYVTVGGKSVKRPAVLKARIGTSIGDLLAECGGFQGRPARLLVGGPFRGIAAYDLEAPITKTTTAILALSDSEVGRLRRSPCIRCGRCARACPEGLDPNRLYRFLGKGRSVEASLEGLGQCTLCGSCGYICPSRVPLVAAFSTAERGSAGARMAK
jgi:electron transport complex protein RnfC